MQAAAGTMSFLGLRRAIATSGLIKPTPLILLHRQQALSTKSQETVAAEKFRLNDHYDAQGKLVQPYPSVSQVEGIRTIQQQVFGVGNPYDQQWTGKKMVKRMIKKQGTSDWYVPDMKEYKNVLKAVIKERLAKTGADLKAPLSDLKEPDEYVAKLSMVPVLMPTAQRKARLVALQRLRKRGKGPPKKGLGKRATRRK